MLERRARAAREHAVVVPATSLVLFRETTIAGTFAGLGGVERLRDWVTLRSGRLPARCTPERCEVLRFRGEGRLPQPAGLRIVEVGEAVLVNRVLFGDFLAPTDNALADAEVSPSVARAAGYRPASCSSASAWGTPRRPPARALRRRAATGGALRRRRPPHSAPDRRRADRVAHVRDGRISDERVTGGGDGAIVVGRGG